MSAPTVDRFRAARAVADAVLYEGYVLYPYRASATKNQLRWQFGVLVPPGYAALDPSERCWARTECVVAPGAAPKLSVLVRFLHAQTRTTDGGDPWDEAVEQEVRLDPVPLLPLASAHREQAFDCPGAELVEAGESAAVVRRREAVDGVVRVDASWADGPGALVKVAVTVENTTAWDATGATRAEAARRSLVAVHTLLAVDDGELVSLLDPPADAQEAARGCVNEGTFPVLVGAGGQSDVVLSSPIILYDHPAVANESGGDLYDATEIDEILALRVLTLTDAEKAEARRTDPRAAAIVDRIDAMSPEAFARLHGTVRPVADVSADAAALPWWEPAIDEGFDPFTDTLWIAGREVSAGTAVRLWPNRRADAHDMFLVGMAATVTGVFTDVDGTVLLAVTVDDDPATEALTWQGRGLFFHPDEVEVLG